MKTVAKKKPSGTKRPAPAKPRTIDEYLASVADDQRRALRTLRTQIKAAAPGATESISYGMPTFKLDGKRLIYFAAWADQCSIYGVPTDAPELRDYEVVKSTIHFSPGKPLPASLVTKLVKSRMALLRKGTK